MTEEQIEALRKTCELAGVLVMNELQRDRETELEDRILHGWGASVFIAQEWVNTMFPEEEM